jgi:hypothetical protein
MSTSVLPVRSAKSLKEEEASPELFPPGYVPRGEVNVSPFAWPHSPHQLTPFSQWKGVVVSKGSEVSAEAARDHRAAYERLANSVSGSAPLFPTPLATPTELCALPADCLVSQPQLVHVRSDDLDDGGGAQRVHDFHPSAADHGPSHTALRHGAT